MTTEKNTRPGSGILNTQDYELRIIKSRRKTISLQIKDQDTVIVKAPYRISQRYIKDFVASHEKWIKSRLKKMKELKESAGEPLSDEEITQLYKKAGEYIPARAAYYASEIGVTYGRITIRKQKTRWGSCSSKGNLNFNCLLMLTPPEAIDSVVVHELCHRKEMNHSEKFYDEVLKVFPDYFYWDRWLKQYGTGILMRGK
ncbi:MAG: M48 family metallopeptidase [Lachnospiraceae bacterium]|nr:M48 family metallopeptidase [Lachnospiraceae bacterium]